MKSSIFFHNQDVNHLLLKKRTVRAWLFAVAKEEGKEIGEISIVLCSDDYLRNLNEQYLQANYLTDVITFDYCGENLVSGDIFISVERVKENAKLFKQPVFSEMLRVILHGLLHLCGYKDKTEKEQTKMREMEEYYLQKII
ncbi:MAG: rRNA maturation RNase YbeY [Lentimicrobiaceae bacterium]|nr:rRNA maturation RNase YbeY [Lentimicrobiaceae bacterium]